MPKFNTPIQGSPFDPFAYETQVEKLTGKKDVLLDTPISGRDTSLPMLSDIEAEQGFSLLSSDPLAAETINETKAANQTGLELTGKALYNIGGTVLFELAKIPGYVGGLGVAAAQKIQGKENVISSVVDNFWVNGFQELQEDAKELLPVHIAKDIQEGNLIDKISSGQWWATTGADGIGFLLSMMVPGQALKTLGLGAKIATAGEALGNSSKFAGKILSKAGVLRDISKSGQLAVTGKVSRSLDSVNAAILNTFTEASAEAANTFDNVTKNLVAQGLSEEEAKLKAGNAAAGVFKVNMALLIGSNLLDEAWLWKGFTNVQRSSGNKVLDKIFTKIDDGTRRLDMDALQKLSKKGWKDILITGSKNFGRQFIKEGFFEEGTQTTLQQQIEKSGDAGFVNNLYNVGAEYFKDFADNVELQESIFLGGVLGGGMSIFQTKNEIQNYNRALFGTKAFTPSGFWSKFIGKRARKEQKGLVGLFQDNYITNFKSIADIAEKDESGNIIYQDDKIVINEDKYLKLAESKANLLDAHIKYDIAVATNNKVEKDVLGDILAYNYLQPFIQQEGGFEVFKEHLGQVTEAWAKQYQEVTGVAASDEQKQDFQQTLSSKAKEFNDLYKEVEDTHSPERYVTPENTQEFREWKDKVFNDKINLGIQNRTLLKTEKEVIELKNDVQSRILLDDLEKAERVAKGELKKEDVKPDPILKAKYDFYTRIQKEIESKKPELRKEYLELFTKEGVKKHRDNYLKNKQAVKEAAQEILAEDAKITQDRQQVQTRIQEFKDRARQQGYQDDEPIVVQDRNNNRYTISTDQSGKTTLTNAEGKSWPVDNKVLDNIDILDKEFIDREQKFAALDTARQAKLEIINEIIEHREKLYSDTLKDLEKTNKEIEESQKQVDEYIKQLKETKLNKRSKKQVENKIAELQKTLNTLVSRRSHLQDLELKYKALLDEYKLYQSLIKQADINFTELKGIISDQILESIKNDDSTLPEDITEVQRAIDKISDHIKQLNSSIEYLEKMLVEMKNFLNSAVGYNAIALSLLTKQKDALDKINKLDGLVDSKFINELSELIRNNGLREALSNVKWKNKFLQYAQKIASVINQSPDTVNNIFGKKQVSKGDVYNYFADIFEDIIKTADETIASAEERNDIKNSIVSTTEEVETLVRELEKANNELNLQKLNKQFIIVDEFTKGKVEKRFVDKVNELLQSGSEQKQDEYTEEPNENPETLSDIFAEGQLGVNRFVVAGLNILYETSGKRIGKDVLLESGLPKQNESINQQLWYKTIDKIASDPKDNISKYKLELYNPKYDDSSDLEKQIGANNTTSRTDGDLVAILIDESGKPVKDGDNFIFTSIWRPDVLHAETPRLAPDAILQPLLKKIGVSYSPYKTFSVSKLTKQEVLKINKYLGIKSGETFTFDELYDKAKQEAKDEYTAWYQNIIRSTSANNRVFVNPTFVSAGKPLQKRDQDGKVIWQSIEENVEGVKITKDKKLSGAQLMIVPKSGNLSVSKDLTVSGKPGDVILSINGNTSILPTKSRNISEEEAQLVMYLLSIGDDASASVPLPKGVFYKIGNVEIKDKVNIFFYRTKDKKINAQLKNFSLLHSIINYGQKAKSPNESDEDFRKRSVGTIYSATKTKKVIYVDWDGQIKTVPISEIKKAISQDKFKGYSQQVDNLFEFLLSKRFNVSAPLLEQNRTYPYPKLVRDKSGNLSVGFDTKKSYHEFLISGDTAVLKTNLVKDSNYPQFVQRNVVFEPTPNLLESEQKKTTAAKKRTEKKATESKPVETKEPKNKEQQSITFLSVEEEQSLLNQYYDDLVAEASNNDVMEQSMIPFGGVIEDNSIFNQLSSEQTGQTNPISSLDDIPNTEEIEDLYNADKILSPNILLDMKLKNGEIQQDCK